MKNNLIYYSVGALLYCPANSDSIANSIINGKFSSNFSLALCLEDTIPDNCVLEAEQKLIQSISNIYEKYTSDGIHIPKIFIRVRNYTQIYELCDSLKDCMDIVTGFIIPKFCLENADKYIDAIFNVNQKSNKNIATVEDLKNSRKKLESDSNLNAKQKQELFLYEILIEMSCRNIELEKPNILTSDAKLFTITKDKKIQLPLIAVDGLGESVAEKIIAERETEPFLSLEDLTKRTKLNKTVLKLLQDYDCVKGIQEENQSKLF